MNKQELNDLLKKVAAGEVSPELAADNIKLSSYTDLGYAKLDTGRELRQGMSEVIYGEGKTKEQIAGIVGAMLKDKEKTILITRMSKDAAEYVGNIYSINYDELSGVGLIGEYPKPDGIGKVVVATGGTSDIPVAEEAAKTCEAYGNEVVRLYDVGVAGMHRLLNHAETIMNAQVIIAIAGMEGALASVIGGMADCPVIAVPTSVGYGASFGGLSALLSMLNSCASGVGVVNIDNGFGAGYLASMINHRKQ
ncbi:MAG: nickel pincer cofactor biosynthesis protein LarB [Lachnospira sp.]